MKSKAKANEAAEPLLEIDRQARAIFQPYRDKPAVRAIGWLSDIGDQPQLRLLAGGFVVGGLARGDARMAKAGLRMLLAHELATAMKNFVKTRVDRRRPRSAHAGEDHKPSRGRRTDKESTSFPSGHTSGAVAVAQAFSATYPEYKAPARLLAGAVGVAQVPRCAHYPSDVAAGIVIGAAAEAIVGLAWRAVPRSGDDDRNA